MNVLEWLTGGKNQYMDLIHCMNHDWPWIWAVVILCTSIIVGYLVIAAHWYRNFRKLKKGLSRTSLFNMVNIFLFCGICGYFFPIMKMWWPAWRLNVIFLMILAYFTWRYALNTPKLRVIYEQINDAGELADELERQKTVSKALLEIVDADLTKPVEETSKVLEEGIKTNDDERVRAILTEALMNLEKVSHKTQELKDIKHVVENGN